MNFTYVYRHPSTSKEPILQNDDLPENIEEYGLSDAREDASSPRGDTSTDLQATSTTAPPCESSGSSKRQQISVGPSLAVYDEDKIGDGDQSPITDPTLQHMHEELFASGGDFASSLSTLSSFSAHCIAGRYRNVRQLLERSSVRQGKNLSDLVELLETRETAMRLSPLLLVFCMLRKLAEGEASLRPSKSTSAPDEACEIQSSKIPSENQKETTLLQQNLLKVVSVLLEYGARPDAKDVAGRTVCFYGAGVCANEASLVATTMCIGAAVSAHCFGKEVVLRDMKDDSFNGIRGIAAGYRTETAQRIVYLFGRKKEEYARNRNIRLVQDPCRSQHSTVAIPPPDEYFNLCNVQNRLGRVCLANLFHSTRRDVAIFLLHKHEASIDIPDWNGDTLRANSLLRGNQVELGVGQFIAAEVIKRARNEQKHNQNNCSACGKHGWKESPMRVCKSCMSVRYCSESCQASHWKNDHRNQCSKLRKLYNECIVVEKPSIRRSECSQTSISSYRPPSHIAFGEKFTIKVQRVSGRNTILVHDKSRECEFSIGPDQKLYKPLLEKVQSEHATAGTKAYMAAAFDKKGNCVFYLNQTKIKTW